MLILAGFTTAAYAAPPAPAPDTSPAVEAGFLPALPGYEFHFPEDEGAHPGYQNEWWYFTGHLFTPEGGEYGFEVTFFRIGVLPPDSESQTAWDLHDLAMAHFALTDVPEDDFRYAERLNRESPYTAMAAAGRLSVFNEGWSVETREDGNWSLHAASGGDAVDLVLTPTKPPAIHGVNGVSVKAPGTGYASHYYSYTRIAATGTIRSKGVTRKCSGTAWMDHEFGSATLSEAQSGWDWFSVQLDNHTELMLYQMRQRNGRIADTSSGSFIAADGRVIHLRHDEFLIEPSGSWTSPATGATYPMGWTLTVRPIGLRITLDPVCAIRSSRRQSRPG